MPHLKLTLAYEGTRYHGWQMQTGQSSIHPLPTIQSVLETALEKILGFRAPLIAAGRTDAGVHAEAQVCHCDIPEAMTRADWCSALNSKLPPDIRILNADIVAPDFHARKDATSKLYAYSLWSAPYSPVPRIQAFVWGTPRVEPKLLQEASNLLIGTHDFASFQNAGTPIRNTVRTIHSIKITSGTIASIGCPKNWPVHTIYFEGDGFLKQMVRNCVGMIVWAGLDKINIDTIPSILTAKDRRALPSPSAPASGLTLMEVRY